MAIKHSTGARNAKMQALCDFIGPDCFIEIRTGARPANPAAAATGTVLVTLRGHAVAFGSAAAGAVTADAIAGVAATNSGNASWFRIYQDDGVTVSTDGDVGAGSGDLSLPAVAIVTGQVIAPSSLVITEGNA